MKIIIVIPTYNEQENVKKLIPLLLEEFKQIKHECHILFVDGNSDDGTQDVINSYIQNEDSIHILVEKEKSGLGAAYVKGFKKAISELKADVVMEMDGDLQHNPKDVKRFIAEIDNGFDYVIGSRRVKGGSVPNEWALYRKFLSWGGSMFARVVLGIWDVKDFTTGFKATRVKGFLNKIELNNIKSEGFAYKIDLLVRTYNLNAKIKEIPIKFSLRDGGISKMEKNNLIDSFKVVIQVSLKQNKHFLRFLVVGTIGAIVDFSFANLLTLSEIYPTYAAVLSAVIAMFTTFMLNNLWTFDQRKIEGVMSMAKKFIPFTLLSTVPIVFRFFLVDFVVKKMSGGLILYNLAILVSIGFGVVWNFLSYSKIIWKKGTKQNEKKLQDEKKLVEKGNNKKVKVKT